MATTEVELDFAPRWYQENVLDARKRFSVWVMHRRAGKTTLAINTLIRDVLTSPHERPMGAYLAPFYRQAKTVAWDILKASCRGLPGVRFNESELRADLPRGRIQLFGADNYDALRGIRLDSLVCDEYAQMSPAAWTSVLRPALADRQGSAVFIGTPWGRGNHFHDLFDMADSMEDWSRAYLPIDATDALPETEVAALKREMTEAEFNQELLCHWSAAVRGAFWGKEMEQGDKDGRITAVPYDKTLPTWVSLDLGMSDATVVTFWQIAGYEQHCIDCLAFQGTSLPDVFRAVEGTGYNVKGDQVIVPHDIAVRELGTGMSRLEVLNKLGINPHVATKLPVHDGIEAVRSMLPRTWFDKDKCSRLLDALYAYRTDYDEKRQVHRQTPLHDWSSDYADSVRYWAVMNGTGQLTKWGSTLDYSEANRMVI